MRSFLDNYRLVMAIAAVVLMIGLLGVAATDRLQRGAHAAETASTAIQRRVLDLLKLSRLLEDFPLAIGTGSEKAARARLESALGRLQSLPDELADHAAQARAAGNAVLAETAERTRIEIQDDLLTLISAVDRIARQERPLVASAHAKRVTGLILQRLLPALSLPQLVLDSERNRLSRRRQDVATVLAGFAGFLVPGMVAFVILPVARAEAHKLRQAQAQLDRAALTDPVTGLPNHRATRRYLESLPPGERVLIIAFEIAPAFGLPDGNEAEIAIGVAGTVGKRLRELETGALFLGQARATRFCIVLPAQENGEISFAQHRDLESLADEPVQLDHRRVRLVFRAGVAVRRPNRPALAALENAGIALDRARAQRATTPVGYRPEYRRRRIAAQRLAQDLRVALMSGEVRPHFQPQIDLRTGAVTGMEALARWHHPRRGVLPPGAFMPQAQRTGLDEPLGEVMLRLGLEALRSWDERGLPVPTVGINAAASQLNNPLFFDFVRWELDRQRVPPERLAIEVLEDIYTPSDDDPIARNLRRLSRIGVRIDLDDFGTAATSVIGMRRYQATRIKIDKSYIRDIGASASNQTLVATMVQMARNMHIESLAEGVETPAERAWLAHVGCDYIQGYVVARPMPLEESFEWLAQYRVPPPQAGGQQG